MSVRHQVPDPQANSGPVVDRNGIHFDLRNMPGKQDDRRAGAVHVPQRVIVMAGGADNDTVDLLGLQGLDVGQLLFRIVVRIAQDQVEPRFLAVIFSAPDGVGHKGVQDAGHHGGDGMSLFLFQTAGQGVRAIIELLDNPFDPLPGLQTHEFVTAVQILGHRTLGNPRRAGHIIDRYCQSCHILLMVCVHSADSYFSGSARCRPDSATVLPPAANPDSAAAMHKNAGLSTAP